MVLTHTWKFESPTRVGNTDFDDVVSSALASPPLELELELELVVRLDIFGKRNNQYSFAG